MKTKFNGILTLLLAFMVQFTFAQERTISGTVSDDLGPIQDITVKVKGSDRGTVTDFDGKYSVQAKTGEVINFTHISYGAVEKIVGASNVLDVTMKISGNALDEVVVTAQGVKREKKTLGYSVTTIKTEEIESKAETDIARILTGKIAGVQTNPAGGLLGSGTNVIIRSKSSITGDNRPLYVVDGAPISGDRYQELDANNIVSTSVLKGLAASTLYGEDGRNGVILITTKTGSRSNAEKGFEISLTNTILFNRVGNLPDFQNKYGQGADQVINTTYFGTWGAEFNGQTVPHHLSIGPYADIFPEFQGATTEYKAVPNNVEDFFGSGQGNNTSLNLSKSGEDYNINFSLGHSDQKGFIDTNTLNRLTLGLGGNMKLSNKFSLSTNFLFSRTKINSPSRGMFQLLTWIPRNLDIHNLPYENPVDHSNVYYRTTINNPLWTLNNSGRKDFSDGFYGKVGLSYEINDTYNLSYRLGMDTFNRNKQDFRNTGGANDDRGFFREVQNKKTIMDNTFIVNADYKEITKNISLTALLGVTLKHEKSDVFGIVSQNQIVHGLISHSNFIDQTFTDTDPTADFVGPDGTPFTKNTIGVYGDFRFGFKEFAFLSLSARNDWSSTVEKENNSLFYPSASFSFLPTTAFSALKGKKNINFLKFRMGYGTSANFPDPYRTRATLAANANSFIDPYTGQGIVTNFLGSFQPNPDLKPERLSEFEVGMEGTFFNRKLNVDLSLYTRTADDQILATDLPATTGFTRKLINIGRVDTEGFELGLTYKVVDKGDFSWTINGNFTAYETTVIEIPSSQINIAGGRNFAVEGAPLGVFIGSYMVRDDNGNLLINPTNGKIITSSSIGLEDKIIGDPNEDWTSSLINTFRYKGLSLSAQVEYRHGGDIWSDSASNLLRRGVTEDTIDREGTYIIPGVLANPNTGAVILDSNAQPVQNNIQIGANDLYFINTVDVDETTVYDASTVRLRNVSLSYNLPKKYLKKIPFGSISITASGNNLWYYSPNMPEHLHIDPEVVSANVGNLRGVDLQNEPSYRLYSMSVKLTF